MSQLPNEMFDVRHIDRYLAEGKVTREQYDAFLEGLEDCSENVEKSAVKFVASERRGVGSGAPSDDEG